MENAQHLPARGQDARSRARGEADARSGAPWSCPDDCDLLSYSLGYADAKANLACCAGERATPEDKAA